MRLQGFDVLGEAKGAGAGYLAQVGVVREIDLYPGAGLVDGRVVEMDGEAQTIAVEGLEAGPLVAIGHLNRLAYAQEFLGRGLLLDAGRLQQEGEWGGRAVHDR